jgi:hypothetical protein
MDDRRLDTIARTLAAGTPNRRAALRLVVAAVLGLPRLPGPVAGAAAGGGAGAAGARCDRAHPCGVGARCRAGRCKCRGEFIRFGRRCAARCLSDYCAATCNACTDTIDPSRPSICVERTGGCPDLGPPCASHADCGPNGVCTLTSCGPGGATENRCQTLCGA